MFSARSVIVAFFISILLLPVDLYFFPPSAPNSLFKLPVMPGVTVTVSQGNKQGDHIADYGSQYAFDFIVGQENFVITAAQGGTVIGTTDSSTIQCGGLDLEIAPQSKLLNHCWTYANFVLIANDDGKTAALYVHLLPYSNNIQMPKVTIGEHFNQGDPIGLAGTMGWSSGIHLHFQVESLPSSVSQQSHQPIGWWWTNSLPITFSNTEVLAQNSNGVPLTDQRFLVLANAQAVNTPTAPVPVPAPIPTQPPTQAPNFTPFVGTWYAHSRALTITSDGKGVYTGRVFVWCGPGVSQPCDTQSQMLGMNTTITFTSISANRKSISGTITSGTGTRDANARNAVVPVGSPITATLQPDDKGNYTLLLVSYGWLGCNKNVSTSDPHYAVDCTSGA